MEDKTQRTVDVMIPVYRPGKKFSRLLTMLASQDYPIRKIIIMNTEQAYWNQDGYAGIDHLEVHHVRKEDFDHGGTRDQGITFSKADIVIFMTDDAVPKNSHMVKELVQGFAKTGKNGEPAAVVYGRQLADSDCPLMEQYTRSFNYPKESRVKTLADLKELGIKTYFASNVCCAYDRLTYMKLGGFITRTIFNEDMIFAGKAIQKGYAVVYAAEAMVIHSHNYTNLQQFHRNFDLAVSQADHPEVFEGIRSENEGVKLIKNTMAYLAAQKKGYLIPQLIVKSGFKYLGYSLGKRYRILPKRLVVWCSMNQAYWR